jgi:hypothetical protein
LSISEKYTIRGSVGFVGVNPKQRLRFSIYPNLQKKFSKLQRGKGACCPFKTPAVDDVTQLSRVSLFPLSCTGAGGFEEQGVLKSRGF